MEAIGLSVDPSTEPRAAGASTRGRRNAALAACAFALLAFAFLAPVRSRAGWDDTFYLLQTSSLVEDGDLDLRNDVLASDFGLADRREILANTTPAGSLDNEFSLGPSLLWLPAYGLAAPLRRHDSDRMPLRYQETDRMALARHERGEIAPETIAPRWRPAERRALYLWSFLALAGVLFALGEIYALAAPPGASPLLPVASLFLGTPLLVYATSDYTMSHLPSAAAAALLLAAALALERAPRPATAFLAGVALGLVVLVRWQDLVFAILLIVPFLGLRALRRAALLAGAAAAGFLAVASLQLHAWRLERGSWLVLPQGRGFFHAAHPELLRFLLSGRSGLLAWSPVFALGILGLLLPWRCRLPRRWAIAALAVLATEIYVNSAVSDWWGGHAFGARRMASSVPLLALGLANLRQGLARQPARAVAALLLVACCAWGLFAALLYRSGVEDLSLVLRGAPAEPESPAIALADEVKDAAEARARLRTLASLSLREPDGDAAATRGGSALTWLLLAATAAAAAAALARAAPRPLLAAVLGGYLVLALGAHLRLALGPHPVAAERAAWRVLGEEWHLPPRRFDRDAIPPPPADPPAAPGAASPADAYRYLDLFLEWRAGDPGRARDLLRYLAGRGYPAAAEAAAALAEIGRRKQVNGEVVRWLPGRFFQPVAWHPALAVPLPASADARSWEIAFALTPLDLARGEVYPLLHLAGAGGEPLVDLSLGDGALRLSTPAGSAGQPCALGSGKPYEIRLLYRRLAPAEVFATLAGAGAPPLHLVAPAPPTAPPAAELTLGRPRGAPLRPLLGSSFADLSVVAGP